MFSMSRSWVEPDTGSLRDDLAALLRQLVDYVGTPETGRVFTSFVDAAAREPELRALLREVERDGRSRFERAIRRGINEASSRPASTRASWSIC
jgi:Tetracyclin repressor-like, C-terminal domain